MINGFEEETSPLTEEEMKLVPKFVNSFNSKIGESMAINSAEIEYKFRILGVKITGPRIRKIVNYIRLNRLVKNLIATSKGYYIEDNPEKLKKYVESLRQRASAIQAVADSYSKP